MFVEVAEKKLAGGLKGWCVNCMSLQLRLSFVVGFFSPQPDLRKIVWLDQSSGNVAACKGREKLTRLWLASSARNAAGMGFHSISTSTDQQGEFLKLLAAFFDLKKTHTYRTRNTETAKVPLPSLPPWLFTGTSQTYCANYKQHFLIKAYFMQCKPEELQRFLDYEMDPPPLQLLPSNSSAISAGECIIHPAVDPMGLPVIKQHNTELAEKSHFQEVQLKNVLSCPLKDSGR